MKKIQKKRELIVFLGTGITRRLFQTTEGSIHIDLHNLLSGMKGSHMIGENEIFNQVFQDDQIACYRTSEILTKEDTIFSIDPIHFFKTLCVN